MSFERDSGILLHPTSLPGRYGIGELGPEAYRFADNLVEMGQHLWQVLPLGPTSYGDSPYQSLSTFAGNPLLIGFDQLVADGLLAKRRLYGFPKLPADAVDYGAVIPARMDVLRTVCRTFKRRAPEWRKEAYEAFCEQNAEWLEDYALFLALKDAHGGRSWTEWAPELREREDKAIQRARKTHATAIHHAKILQYLFFDQWHRLAEYCHERHIKLIGDIPIFVAHDSADVWANRELFYIAPDGQPTVIAGVPPDYFSETGQRWGNPLYRWDVHEEEGYAWWIKRMHKVFELVDIVRIDHFRGFEAYWEIAASEPTAVRGHWVPGPGAKVFEAMRKELGELPIIAEDLGVITDEVEALRDQFEFPGMRVLHFAFGEDPKAEDYRPENFPENCVCYTGTHDNDTTIGWFWSEAGANSTRTQEDVEQERGAILEYLGSDGSQIHWDLIATAARSPSRASVYPLQDVLGLDSSARMNVPGDAGGNWQWRFRWEQLTPKIKQRLADIARQTGRFKD